MSRQHCEPSEFRSQAQGIWWRRGVEAGPWLLQGLEQMCGERLAHSEDAAGMGLLFTILCMGRGTALSYKFFRKGLVDITL